MRIYNVEFAHVKFGTNWTRSTVAVRGHAQEAIQKALKRENNNSLRVEQVILVAEGH